MRTLIKQFFGKRWVKAVFLGAAGVFALPPYFFVPAVFFAFAGLLRLLDGASGAKDAVKTGWGFGFGYFGFGLAWVSQSMLIDGMGYEALAPFPPLGFGLWGAMFPAAACGMAFLAPKGIFRALALSGAWILTEMLRGVLFTGFPWNPVGSVWTAFPAMTQTASLFGVYGLSGATVFCASLFAYAGKPLRSRRNSAPALSVLLLLSAALYGGIRLNRADTTFVRGVTFRLVQPNIPQGRKWSADAAELNLMKHVHLSRQGDAEAVTHVLWPETASSFFLLQDRFARSMVTGALTQGSILLAGSLRSERVEGRVPPYKVYNSIVAFNDLGIELGHYDKSHLVPFGEYAPLQDYLPFIRRLVPGNVDFSEGEGVKTSVIPRTVPLGFLICYEVIFPGRVADKQVRPYWLMNATNDGWFGTSAGPFQHLAAAQMRSVEEGLPLARVANTGISAMIDAYGRIVASLPLGREGYLDVGLPRRTEKPTFYGTHGNKVPLTAGAAAVLIGLAGRRRKKK